MAKLLIVDDEADIRDALAELIDVTFPTTEIRTAKDGASALDELESWSPDVIVSDYRMPGMHGLDFLREAQSRHGPIPSILLTAYDQRGDAVAAAQEGIIRRFYGKPPDVAAILEGIRELLGLEPVE